MLLIALYIISLILAKRTETDSHMESHTLTVNPDKLNQLALNVGTVLSAMQVSQVNLFELDSTKLGPVQISSLNLLALPQHRSHIRCELVERVQVYSVGL